LVCFAFLILFFEPSSVQIGKQWIPGSGAALFVIGLLLNIYGLGCGSIFPETPDGAASVRKAW